MQAPEEKIYLSLARDLSKNFDFEAEKAVLDVENFFEQFEQTLSARIFDLIQNDYNRLMAILYRIDVDEKTVRDCLGSDIFSASDKLAHAVVERLLQKIRYRMQGQ